MDDSGSVWLVQFRDEESARCLEDLTRAYGRAEGGIAYARAILANYDEEDALRVEPVDLLGDHYRVVIEGMHADVIRHTVHASESTP